MTKAKDNKPTYLKPVDFLCYDCAPDGGHYWQRG